MHGIEWRCESVWMGDRNERHQHTRLSMENDGDVGVDVVDEYVNDNSRQNNTHTAHTCTWKHLKLFHFRKVRQSERNAMHWSKGKITIENCFSVLFGLFISFPLFFSGKLWKLAEREYVKMGVLSLSLTRISRLSWAVSGTEKSCLVLFSTLNASIVIYPLHWREQLPQSLSATFMEIRRLCLLLVHFKYTHATHIFTQNPFSFINAPTVSKYFIPPTQSNKNFHSTNTLPEKTHSLFH